jgi:hypothetical protein
MPVEILEVSKHRMFSTAFQKTAKVTERALTHFEPLLSEINRNIETHKIGDSTSLFL